MGGLTAMDRLRGLIAAVELVEGELPLAVKAARDEGADVLELAWLLGVDRSTVYRRYLAASESG
ncbi:MAG: hypothetical protein JWO62_3141 [Acidimicrobiaceae bacterium]|nr:hypothetical protein [Acidimicrobiaceae bacterium]